MAEEKCFVGKPHNIRKGEPVCSLVQASATHVPGDAGLGAAEVKGSIYLYHCMICIHFSRFLLQWLKAEILSFKSDPKISEENTQAQGQRGQVQHFTTGSG